MTPSRDSNNSLVIRINGGLVIAMVTIAILVIGWFVHEQNRRDVFLEGERLIVRNLSSKAELLSQEMDSSRRKGYLLQATPPVQGIVRATENGGIDPYDGTPLALWKERLVAIFIAFISANPEIIQLRYIGVADNGRELVRVDRELGIIKVISSEDLQQKGERDYFQSTIRQHKGGSYISDFNLNRERGEIVFPPQPTYRVGIPVYNSRQQIFGAVIINVDPSLLIQRLQQQLPESALLFLLNGHGGFIVDPRQERHFLFEYDETAVWQNEYHVDANSIERVGLSRYSDRDTGEWLYASEVSVPLSNPKENRTLRLVLALPEAVFSARVFKNSTQVLLVGAGLLVVMILSLLIYRVNVARNRRLDETRAQYEAIIDGSSDAIIAMDGAGMIEGCNISAQELFGYSERQLLGNNLIEFLVGDEDRAAVTDIFRRVVEGKYQEPLKLELQGCNGVALVCSVALSPIRVGIDTVGVAAIVRDIRDQEEVERKILEINASLEQQVQERTRELEVARNEAVSASGAKSLFIANVSHEIRTPLNGIVGMLKLIRKSHTPDQLRRYLDMAETSADALASLINDVLDFSKIEAGKLEVQASAYNLLDIASDIVVSMSVEAQQRGLELILDMADAGQHQLVGDSHRLRQILTNLVGNALKFTSSGWIKVTLSSRELADGRVELTGAVQDTGVGVSAEAQQQVFGAFSQEDGSVTRKFGGTGLGLSITRQLCQLMGGDISLTSEKGKGSTFSFTLVQRAATEQQNVFEAIDLSDRRILIVEPNTESGSVLQKQLLHWRAAQVDCVGSIPSVEDGDDYDLWIVDESVGRVDRVELKAPVVWMVHHLGKNQVVLDDSRVKYKLLKPVIPFALVELLGQVGFVPKPLLDSLKPQRLKLPHQESMEKGEREDLSFAGARVLVVDDNKINREVAAGYLEDFGLQLSTAEDGEAALKVLATAKEPYHLVLMDCQMPVMDGYTAVRQLRSGAAGEAASHVPVVGMTASAMEGDRERCLLAGMDDYITKPLEPEEVESKVAHWLSGFAKSRADSQTKDSSKGEDTASSQALGPELQGLPVWDREGLLRRVRNKEDRAKQLITIFLSELPDRVNQLQQAVGSGDREAMVFLAHALKGAAGIIGAVRVQTLAEFIESSGRNITSIASLDNCITVLQSESEALTDILNSVG